jgi:hypothetical protein
MDTILRECSKVKKKKKGPICRNKREERGKCRLLIPGKS